MCDRIPATSYSTRIFMLVCQPFLVCRNQQCQTQIQLPYSIPQQTFEHQVRWPTSGWKRTFLCQSCMSVYDYTPAFLHWDPIEKQDPSKHAETVGSIEIVCEPGRCQALIRVFAVLDDCRSNRQRLEELRIVWRFAEVECENDHQVMTPQASSGQVSYPDARWF